MIPSMKIVLNKLRIVQCAFMLVLHYSRAKLSFEYGLLMNIVVRVFCEILEHLFVKELVHIQTDLWNLRLISVFYT